MSKKFKVFVDGQVGTTGIEIHQRLSLRDDVELIEIDHDKRKDPIEKAKLLNEADVVFLCLPDSAAKESVSLITNSTTKVIDASTAHRVDDNWVYGIAELSASQREKIANATRVSNPGCHATGFNVIVAPLVDAGLLPSDAMISSHSMTGYSGGGRQLIEEYEANQSSDHYKSSRHYALSLSHKHIPEMTKVSKLTRKPLFTPVLGNFYKGMLVSIPFFASQFSKKVTAKDIHAFLANHYAGQTFVKVMPFDEEGKTILDATGCNGTNVLEIYVNGDDEQIFISSKLDNLGKGASGAAIQNMNIMLGIDETIGL